MVCDTANMSFIMHYVRFAQTTVKRREIRRGKKREGEQKRTEQYRAKGETERKGKRKAGQGSTGISDLSMTPFRPYCQC
jgi:hypothetical protein